MAGTCSNCLLSKEVLHSPKAAYGRTHNCSPHLQHRPDFCKHVSRCDGLLRARCWSHDASMTGAEAWLRQLRDSAAARPPLMFPLKPMTLIFFFNGYTSKDKTELQNQRSNNFSLAIVIVKVKSPFEQTRLWNMGKSSPFPLAYLNICYQRKEADYESKGGYCGLVQIRGLSCCRTFWWRVEKSHFLHVGVGSKVVLCWFVMPPVLYFLGPWLIYRSCK